MSTLFATAARPSSLSQVVYDAIRDAIVSEQLPQGSAISEVGLARTLGVSKTPVREALMRLKELRLVEPSGPQGLRVVVASRERIVEAYETRVALEASAARLVAQRADDGLRAELLELAEATVQAAENDPAAFREADRLFHTAVIDGARSSYLAELAKDVLVMAAVLRARDVPVAGDSVQCAREHVEIARAIGAGEGELASTAMRGHIETVQHNVVTAFDIARKGASLDD